MNKNSTKKWKTIIYVFPSNEAKTMVYFIFRGHVSELAWNVSALLENVIKTFTHVGNQIESDHKSITRTHKIALELSIVFFEQKVKGILFSWWRGVLFYTLIYLFIFYPVVSPPFQQIRSGFQISFA